MLCFATTILFCATIYRARRPEIDGYPSAGERGANQSLKIPLIP